MLKYARWLVWLLVAWCLIAGAKERNPSPLVDMVEHAMPGAHVGFMVQDLDNGEWLYRWHGFDYFVPASNDKLFVASAALVGLGESWQYDTTVAMPKGKLKKGVLNGDVVFRFVGDPTFTEKDLDVLVKAVRKRGILKVRRVLVDAQRFSGSNYAPGWTQDSLVWGYSAPVTSAMMDENKIPVTLEPSQTLGDDVRVQMNRYQKTYLTSAAIRTVSAYDAEHRCSIEVHVDQNNHMAFSGCWPIDLPKKTVQIAMRHPERYIIDRLQYLFKRNGIKVADGFVMGHLDGKVDVVAHHESPKLSSMLRPVLRDSNNLYAESMLKTLGWKYRQTGSFQEGVNVMRALLSKKLDIDFSVSDLFDGSGVSRYDEVTPELLARLLYVMYHDDGLYETFYKAFPDAGHNGTLQRRMRGFDLKENVKAKTGSMKHVSTLSGYMTTRSKRHLGFVILINGIVGPLAPARDLQNRMCQFLYNV